MAGADEASERATESVIYSSLYDELWGEVLLAVALRSRLLGGLPFFERLKLRRSLRHDPLGLTRPDSQARMRAKATRADVDDGWFAPVTATYWLEAVACRACATLDLRCDRLAALMAIHEARQRTTFRFLNRLNFPALAGLIVAVFSVVASQLPKESFEVLGGDGYYGWYRFALFVLLCLSLALMAAVSTLTSGRLQVFLLSTDITGHVLHLCRVLPPQKTEGHG